MNYDTLCQICQEKSAPYRCPKCQLKYCSLTCYRDQLHEKCSRKFDEKELIDSMTIDEIPDENRTTTNNFVRERIEDILKRKLDEKDFHNDEDDGQIDELFEHLLPTKDSQAYREEMGENDEGDDDEGEERIASDEEPPPDLPNDVDESDENVNQLWSYLTTEEKQEFKKMLQDGRISHLLNDYKPWKPWWLFKTSAPPLVSDLDTSTASGLPDTIPAIASNIVPLPSLTSILPHVHVRFDVFEVLFAYVLISIRYRGDFQPYIAEAGTEFVHVASRHFTQKPDPFDEQEDPVSILRTRTSLLRECLHNETISCSISEEFFVNLFADVISIIHGPYSRQTPSNTYVLAALSDLKRFLIQIQDYKPPESEESSKPSSTITNVFHTNRPVKAKQPVNRSANSKLRIESKPTISKTSPLKKTKKPKIFSRKLVQSLSHKIDYFLSWTITHSNRLVILEHELEQIEHELRYELTQYQHDKNRIERNLKQIRLHQQSTNVSNRIQEL
ncbi:unnamed protein product [Adineta ricciae]|uniref:HIT-type domain-containing protein n=1 Tax=Adineta ricciae TaxID=249248 RepID=A0A814JRE3_ADIRI|nr:unnamed protein product [Adineta ricciae]CAF1041544.1 unnamed protein product [Adineta ricciae]